METQTSSKKYLSISGLIILILSLLLVSIGGFLLYDYKVAQIEDKYTPEPIIIHDTIVRDSIQIQEKIKWKYRTVYDTAFVIQKDTVSDTVYMEIPIDHYQYRDTIETDSVKYTLGINYSGFKPRLDSVWVNHSYTPHTIVKTKKNGWGWCVSIGPQIGYGATINTTNRTFVPGPYVGIGVSIGWCYHWSK